MSAGNMEKVLRLMADKIQPTDAFPDEAAAIVREVERKEAAEDGGGDSESGGRRRAHETLTVATAP